MGFGARPPAPGRPRGHPLGHGKIGVQPHGGSETPPKGHGKIRRQASRQTEVPYRGHGKILRAVGVSTFTHADHRNCGEVSMCVLVWGRVCVCGVL